MESLCEHVIAGEQEVKVNCQERESGNGMAPWDIISSSSLRVRLKRETLRQVAERGTEHSGTRHCTVICNNVLVCKVILGERRSGRPALGLQEPVTLYFALAR